MLTLVPGEMGGSEQYARELCRALGAAGRVDAVAFVAPIAAAGADGLRTEVVREVPLAGSPFGKTRGMSAAMARRRSIRRRFGDVDVVHYPFTVPVPPLGLPTVITLQDLQHLDLPDLFTRRKRVFRRVAYDRAARHADAVIVPSDFTRDRAIALLGLDPERVITVHYGIDHDTFAPSDVPREPFLLYPARPWRHKNHDRLLQAFALLHRSHPHLKLVLTGGGTEALAGPDGVVARGAVPGSELVELYRRASCVVFPSLYEGFGQPPLEAMACGTPVAASTAGSLPEVCGDAAVLFDPLDVGAIASSVAEALGRSAELSALGLARAAAFTWDASAEGHERAYATAAHARS